LAVLSQPIIPGLLLYGWEWINFLLPPGLKKVSVIHYLQSLVPVPMSEGRSQFWLSQRRHGSPCQACFFLRGRALSRGSAYTPHGDQLCR
jgi:hypothetical protein